MNAIYLVGLTTTDGGCHDCYPQRVCNSVDAAKQYVKENDRRAINAWRAYGEDMFIATMTEYTHSDVEGGWWEGWYIRREFIS